MFLILMSRAVPSVPVVSKSLVAYLCKYGGSSLAGLDIVYFMMHAFFIEERKKLPKTSFYSAHFYEQ